jgi:hypothetical protein
MMVGQLQNYCQLPTRYQILGYLQSITSQAALCKLNKIWPRNSNAWACCLSIVYNVSDSQRLAIGHKPSSCLCTGYNVAKIFGSRAYCCQLSARYQILRDLQCVTNQAVICELEPTWPRDSNTRAYCCQLSTTCQIIGDSQCITNYTAVWAEYNVLVNRFQKCYQTKFQPQPHLEFYTKKRAK